jgi:GrpB-like predicted nucleotidyltransferase (UPF0157 family)
MKRIELKKYNPNWSEIYKTEISSIKKVFQDELMLHEHVGSTALANVPAVPVIDIVLGVQDVDKVNVYNKQMEALGYQAKGEYGVKGRRFFIKKKGAARFCEISVFTSNSEKLWFHLNLQRYMQKFPEVAQKYAETKINLAKKFAHDMRKYLRGKKKFITSIETKVNEWAVNERLETDRLIMRPFTLDDTDAMHQLAGVEEIAGSTSEMPFPLARSMVVDWIVGHRDECAAGRQAVFVIELKETGKMIGSIELITNRKKMESEIGYWIETSLWRKGYGYEAACAVMRYGFCDLHMRRIFAMCFKWNEPSRKMMQKLGMEYEKVFTEYVEKWNRKEEIEQYFITRAKYFEKFGAPSRI